VGGGYRIIRELGRGGMGVVYEADDLALKRRVAIKRMLGGANGSEAERAQFLREAQAVARLRHPRLVQIFNVLSDGDLFLVFELVDGEPLDQVLARRGKLPPAEVRRLLADTGAALQCAHAERVIHRDLKPANVVVERSGSAKVMDFGIAHQASVGATQQTSAAASGTPPYMAPEQCFGTVSKASDLYSLGVMAYELLLGRRPFDGEDHLQRKLRGEFPPPSAVDPSLPRGLDAFFARALAPDPTRRFGSADELLAGFDAAVRG
jgi:serine/threonine-protein kinase